jgi:hypothetical protein
LSEDLINFNGWHHVSVRWGGPTVDFGTGSFFIDGAEAGDFYIPSSSVTSTTHSVNSNALFIGNYYDGSNAGSNRISGFFNEDAAAIEGFTDPFTSTLYDIPTHVMNHPFGGEIHEARVWKVYRELVDILSGTRTGVSSSTGDLKFYLGPHFVHESPVRQVLYTPFQTITTSTNTPYAKELSFGVGGHLINAENHLRDMVSGYYPRLYHMTASEITQTNTSNLEASQFLFATASNVQKNLLILPCDNGKFFPNYNILLTSSNTPYYSGGPGMIDLSSVITDEVNLGFDNDSMVEQIAGVSPTSLSGSIGSTLTIYQRTKDPSSNLVTFFDASNLFYGSKIHPGSYELIDSSFTGSNGLLSVKVKDNGAGGLYRADASTVHAKWNSVGALLYEEGLAVITSPYFGELFGKDSFSVNFKGEHPVPLLTTNVSVPAYQINSSSMPSYLPLTASDYANEVGDPIVYISRINFHDENLNIVARTELAQPIAKRLSDKFTVKVKFDF